MTHLAIAKTRPSAILQAILQGFARHVVLYVFAGLVMAAAMLEAWWLNLPFDFQMVKIFSGPVLLILCVLIVCGPFQQWKGLVF